MTTAEEHPTFPNPSIQEAICQVRFRLPGNWEPPFFELFYRQVKDQFPVFEPASIVDLQMQLGPGAQMAHFLAPPRPMMRYKRRDNMMLLQLAADFLTVNLLPRYPGWAVMRSATLEAWERLSKALEPSAIVRIGLRYINRIELADAAESPGGWLAPSDYLAAAAVCSAPGLLYRLECRPEAHTSLIVTLGEVRQPEPRALIFDIDCVSDREHPPKAESVGSTIDALHRQAWQVFSASMTPRLRARLEGRQP